MTSVASFGAATTAGNYTLVHSGTTIGNYVDGFTTNFSRLTPINKRQNFWASTVILDGRFPAQEWSHEFSLYTEAGSIGGLYEKFLKIHDQIDGDPQLLVMNDGNTTNAVYEFGQCYLEAAALGTPDQFNLHAAAKINVTFVGKTRPIVNNLP